MWNKLGDQFFLMPDPRRVRFTTQVLVGYADGSATGQDEYGRAPQDTKEKQHLRDLEFVAFEKHKQAWDTRFGERPYDPRDW